MKQCFNRGSDFCFRLGGEEFGVIFAYDSLDGVLTQTQLLRKSIEELHIEHIKSGVSSYVTASIGIAIVEGSTSPESVYSIADQ